MTAIIGLVIIAGGLVGWNLFLQQSKKIEPASMDKMAFLLPDKPSIAVLPFENIGGDPEQDYIVDGITDNIITGLSQIPRIFVIAQNSSSTYKGKPVKIRQVSEELGVRYVLEGRVQKAGARLRINVQLIEATRGHHLWAKGYDRELKDIFTLQDEITQKILTSIAVTLTEGEQARLLSKGTSNLKAYLKSLQAREIGRQLSPDSNVKEREMWEETIEIDPEFSLGYSSLGWTYLREVWFGWSKSPEKSMEMAVEFAQKALDLDQSLAVAHALMGCIYLGKRQYDKAITWGKRAVTLSPNDSDIMALLAITLNNADKSEEAILYFKKATRLNPFSPAWYFNSLGYAYFKAGQYDDSIKTIKRALNISPKMFLAHLNLIATYSYLGRDSEAKAAAKEFLSLYPEFTISESFAEAFFDKDRADVDDFIAALRKAGIK
jgi:adenylate cyclase